MVEVFKTNIVSKEDAKKIIEKLQKLQPFAKINFDLEDCDNILRIEDEIISPKEIIEYLVTYNVIAFVLEKELQTTALRKHGLLF